MSEMENSSYYSYKSAPSDVSLPQQRWSGQHRATAIALRHFEDSVAGLVKWCSRAGGEFGERLEAPPQNAVCDSARSGDPTPLPPYPCSLLRICFLDNHHHHEKSSESRSSLLPSPPPRRRDPPSDICDSISSRRLRSSSCWPRCYRDSRHPGSAIDDVRGRICGRGLPNGPAKCRASRRVRVRARKHLTPPFLSKAFRSLTPSIAMKDCRPIFRCCRT